METNNLPALFIENSVERLRRVDMMRVPCDNMPVEMRDNTIPVADDWIGWKIIPSTVTDAQLNELEKQLRLSYPPIYRQLLKSYHFYELWDLRFQEHPIHSWREGLLQFYAGCDDLIAKGLIPFAIEPVMDGTVCFDSTKRLENGDCPVVFWDHEWIGTDKELNPLFSSGEAMFRCLNFIAETPINFLVQNEALEPEELSIRQKLMANFLALDPTGAGGTARDYWTMGVKTI